MFIIDQGSGAIVGAVASAAMMALGRIVGVL